MSKAVLQEVFRFSNGFPKQQFSRIFEEGEMHTENMQNENNFPITCFASHKQNHNAIRKITGKTDVLVFRSLWVGFFLLF